MTSSLVLKSHLCIAVHKFVLYMPSTKRLLSVNIKYKMHLIVLNVLR